MSAADQDPWTATTYPRGSAPFERAVFFSDAVFAIALTLVAVEIGVPEIADGSSATELWDALVGKAPTLLAFGFTFFWIGFYWLANHRFTATLAAIDRRYLAALLVYLAFIAVLPFPAATFGEYFSNPVALSFFSVVVAIVSSLEVLLLLVADRRGLFIRPLTAPQRRQSVLGSLSPVVGFLAAIPLAFVSPWLAVVSWFLIAWLLQLLLSRLAPAAW